MPRSKSAFKPILLYTLGDPAGVGPEILLKLFSRKSYFDAALHVVTGDSSIISKTGRLLSCELDFQVQKRFALETLDTDKLHLIDLKNAGSVSFGSPSADSGKASMEYLEAASEILKVHGKDIAALITLPVSKQYIRTAGFEFKGHTEYLRDKFKAAQVEMLFLTSKFDLLLCSRHVPLKEAIAGLNRRDLERTVSFAAEFYLQCRGITPAIAFLGLNPHAGEAGNIGGEEKKIIEPVIKKLREKNLNVSGPFPADGFFRNLTSCKFDLVVSIYHDQALPAVKVLFKDAVNFTLGLPFLRFSPDHGTAFDIAGKGIAKADSLKKAVEYALNFEREKR